MKVLRVRPKHYPEVIDIDCSLESLQKEVVRWVRFPHDSQPGQRA